MQKPISVEKKNRILYLHSIGYNNKKIGEDVGLDHRTIAYHLKKNNLSSNHIEIKYENEYDRIKGYMIRNSKFQSKRRNIYFDLKYEDFELPLNCPILNIPLEYKGYGNFNSSNHATLDRIDNSKGYVKGNVIVVSRLANSMKNNANFEQLHIFSKNIVKLINYYKNQGALGSITDIFPNVLLKTF